MDFDITQIIDLLNSTVFPIAMCILLLWIVNSTMRALRDTMVSLQETIANNTKVIEDIAHKVENKNDV